MTDVSQFGILIMMTLMGWGIYKLDRTLTVVAKIEHTLFGPESSEGEGGLVKEISALRKGRHDHANWLTRHESEIKGLEYGIKVLSSKVEK